MKKFNTVGTPDNILRSSEQCDRTADEDGANIQVCPFCKTQNAMSPNGKRKMLRCTRCTSRFPILTTAGTGNCAHCGTIVSVPKWIVGRTVLCPDCSGGLDLEWE